jgi:hypothetical protein
MRLLPLPVAPLAPFQNSKFESACGRWWGALPFVTLQFREATDVLVYVAKRSEPKAALGPACRAPSNLIFRL